MFRTMTRTQQTYCLTLLMFFVFFTYFYMSSTNFSNVINPNNYGSLKEFFKTSGEVLVPLDTILKGDAVHMEQDDPRVLDHIRQKYLDPPSVQEYNLEKPDKDPSMGQSDWIKKIFKNQPDGFFVECGALDGETRSNTLFFEKNWKWKGLIIEADPKNYEILKTKHRKAWSSNTCLAVKPYAHQVVFKQHFNIGKIMKSDVGSDETNQVSKNEVVVQCFPIYSLLAALNVTTVDYFSLDVEGNELDVLQTIPFDSIYIKTLSVEFLHVDAGKSTLQDFMISKGFTVVGQVTNAQNLANDFIFVNNKLKNN